MDINDITTEHMDELASDYLTAMYESQYEDETIETWKIDLERLLWSYHENGRPDGKTGVIGNPKTIEEFVRKLLESTESQIKQSILKAIMEKLPARRKKMKFGLETIENDLISEFESVIKEILK